jgi:hypothetical protein
MNTSTAEKLIKECRRQEESCLYTSTTLYIWLREARRWRGVFVVVPIILGAIASWSILDRPDNPWALWVTAAAGLVAGLLPTIRDALGLDLHVEEMSRHAAQFKNLQDRFRLAADTGESKSEEAFETEVRDLLERLDEARKASMTPPERCFVKAQHKIKAGHYAFAVDHANP